jgi:TetR/AcrR family transcriptional regulator, transcriptional repressor for nem operon
MRPWWALADDRAADRRPFRLVVVALCRRAVKALALCTYNGRVSRSVTGRQNRPTSKLLPVTQRGRQTRAAIVEAAATLMYTNGVHATSLDDILAASGTGKSQLYHYFSDKADLVRAVIDRQLDLVLASQPALNRVDSWEGIDRWVTEILDAHSLPGGPFACPLGTVAAELKNDDTYRPHLKAAFSEWEGRLARGLAAMQARGDIAAEADPQQLATSAIAALQGGMLLARIHGDANVLRETMNGAVAVLQSNAPARRGARSRPAGRPRG